MKPSVGRIVIVKLTEAQRKALGGNHVVPSDNPVKEAPAIIVKTWGSEETSAVNLKVFGDSGKDLWVSSATQGDQEGQWSEPPRV